MDPKKSLLLIVDIQEGFRKTLSPESVALVVDHIETLTVSAQVLNIPIWITEQYPQGLGETISEIKSLVKTPKIFSKLSFSALGEADFLTALKKTGRTQIVMVGMETQVCIFLTAQDLIAKKFKVSVGSNGVLSRTSELRDEAIDGLRQLGALVAPCETFAMDWIKAAKKTGFREMSELLKRNMKKV